MKCPVCESGLVTKDEERQEGGVKGYWFYCESCNRKFFVEVK